MSQNRCFAKGCNRLIDEKMLMCGEHWYQVPKEIQDEVWRTYRARLRRGGVISREYSEAIIKARKAVA